MLDKKIQRIGNISGRGALFSKPLKTRYSCDRDGRFEYHNPYELQKKGEDFFKDFSFFDRRFWKENLWKFISQMGNALGVCESGYGSKNA